jgi:hypothetical protein
MPFLTAESFGVSALPQTCWGCSVIARFVLVTNATVIAYHIPSMLIKAVQMRAPQHNKTQAEHCYSEIVLQGKEQSYR